MKCLNSMNYLAQEYEKYPAVVVCLPGNENSPLNISTAYKQELKIVANIFNIDLHFTCYLD